MTWNTPKPGEWKSEELSQGRIIDYKAFNFVDGEGVRNSLYVAGCMFHCEGCYNVATWSFNAGIPYTKELEEQIMADLAQPYVQGLTLLGGGTLSQHWHPSALGQAREKRVARQRYLVLDRIHLGRNDARDTRQTRASLTD